MRTIKILAAQPAWFLSLVVGGFALAFGLILLGAKGNEIAGPLALGVGVISIAVALLALRRQKSDSSSTDEASESNTPTSRRVFTVMSFVVVLVAAAAGTAYSTLVHKRDLHAADQIAAIANERLTGNEARPTVFTLRPELDGRDFISFRIDVVNPGGSGNCEGQTRLVATPILDGSPGSGDIANLVSGQEFDVRVAGAVHGGVSIRTSGQPPPCAVNLYVTEATAHNDFPW